MTKRVKKSIVFLSVCLGLIFTFMAAASRIQRDSGRVEVGLLSIQAAEGGEIAAKLYRPETATAQSPAPAVLLIHGYQNDKDASGAAAIELARRGYVVLAIDAYGHGSTGVGLAARGYVNHKVSVNFGEDSEADGTYAAISGPMRYKVMLNFSNLSFFNEHYSRDAEGNAIEDSSVGGIAAYAALAAYDFVDGTRMAVGGHSMGTWASWSVAAAYAGTEIAPKAVVLQAGELFTQDVYDSESIRFNNVLLLQAKYDEFAMFRDYNSTVTEELPRSALRAAFLGVPPGETAWNTTFGDFADGSARRMELVRTNHRLITHSGAAVAQAMEWFDAATGNESPVAPSDKVYLIKEMLTFACLLLALAAMLGFMELLLALPFFQSAQPGLPDRPERTKQGRAWRRGAAVTILVAGLTYPFMAQLGHGLLPLPERIFRMTVGNGFLAWYLLLIVVMLVTTALPWKKAKKAGAPLDYCDLGFAGQDNPARFDWGLLGKSALLALLMAGFVYLLVWVCQSLFLLDFRVIWPFFRPFSLARLGQFFVYIPVFALFFVLNNSKIFAQMRTPATGRPGFKGFLSCWWRNAICMAGGVFLICLVEYIPFFAGMGPGADLLFSPLFGGPFMSLLLIFFPQILVLSLLCTYIHRRTGHVFVSGLTAGILSCWIIAGGSAML